ncbi:hypothetical protein VNO77_33644 [Canavalia gladiata]|uniref:Secreted protein n=1 Tax=Canavalia gladiata TaxID=3824 RepID=A0AAN9KF97_CANGL
MFSFIFCSLHFSIFIFQLCSLSLTHTRTLSLSLCSLLLEYKFTRETQKSLDSREKFRTRKIGGFSRIPRTNLDSIEREQQHLLLILEVESNRRRRE